MIRPSTASSLSLGRTSISSTATMASIRTPALRHTIFGAAPYLRALQKRFAQVHDVRFLATQQSDRVLDKYREKLERKAKEYD